jgi:hypothetical protein
MKQGITLLQAGAVPWQQRQLQLVCTPTARLYTMVCHRHPHCHCCQQPPAQRQAHTTCCPGRCLT